MGKVVGDVISDNLFKKIPPKNYPKGGRSKKWKFLPLDQTQPNFVDIIWGATGRLEMEKLSAGWCAVFFLGGGGSRKQASQLITIYMYVFIYIIQRTTWLNSLDFIYLFIYVANTFTNFLIQDLILSKFFLINNP